MAVIRDVNLDTTNDNVIFIGSICVLLSLTVAILGIKLRWFKHRMNLSDMPSTPIATNQSNGIEPQIIRAKFRPSEDFDNYVEVTPPKVLPPVRIPKSARNAISLPPRKRQAPDIPILRVTSIDACSNEIEPLPVISTVQQFGDSLVVDERRLSTPPPPLPASPPPIDNPESQHLLFEANNNYNYNEEIEKPTFKLKEGQNVNKPVVSLPPPYQIEDPLATPHFRKYSKNKTSPTPLPSVHKQEIISLQKTEIKSPKTAPKLLNSSPLPKETKNEKKNSFLHQVTTPTELPKLAFDFPSKSMPNLSDPSKPLLTSTESTLSLSENQLKSNEKKSFFGLFSRNKANGSAIKHKTEKPEHPPVEKVKEPKANKNNEAIKAKTDKEENPLATKLEKAKVKKIRVLKTPKKEDVPKGNLNKNTRVVADNDQYQSIENSDRKGGSADSTPNLEFMENRMEIDYFQKVKKAKPNRVPIIVKSPKAQIKSEEKPVKSEVFRHEETFSAANGPVKAKKKKNKLVQGDTSIANSLNTSDSSYNDPIKIKPTSPKLNENIPVPKPRVVLKLEGFDDNHRETEINSKAKRNIQPLPLSSPSSPSDTELDTWNLVAQHRLNTRAINAASISIRQQSKAEVTTNGSMLQTKQMEILNKPKTMREMKREQEEKRAQAINLGDKNDRESDTEA